MTWAGNFAPIVCMVLASSLYTLPAAGDGMEKASTANVGERLPGPILIFFASRSDRLGPQARRLAREAARIYRVSTKKPDLMVSIYGLGEKTSEDGDTVALDKQRFNSLKAFLISNGVAEDKIALDDQVKMRPRKANFSQVVEPTFRRAEIRFDY